MKINNTEIETIWMMAIIGAVCVIGLVDFAKCWISDKKKVKWIVFFISLIIGIVLSPLTSPLISTIIIMWLLILAIATIARNAIVDGLPSLISKVMGSNQKSNRGE